jgi:hypothetical protein
LVWRWVEKVVREEIVRGKPIRGNACEAQRGSKGEGERKMSTLLTLTRLKVKGLTIP